MKLFYHIPLQPLSHRLKWYLMETQQGQLRKKITKLNEAIKRRLSGRRNRDHEITQSASEQDINTESKKPFVFDEASLNEIKKIINSLTVTSDLRDKKISVLVTPENKIGIEASSMADLIISQEGLDLTSAEVGDVVWWRDKASQNGYFMLTKKYEINKRINENGYEEKVEKFGKGKLRHENNDGSSIESNDSIIEGATFGTMINSMHIRKNVPIKLIIDGKEYLTNPVETMGIIRAQQIQTP